MSLMQANALAAAVAILSGKPVHVLCAGCLEETDPQALYSARECKNGGDCERCSYSDEGNVRGTGMSDIFITTNPNLPQCPAQALTMHIVECKLAVIEVQS